VCKNTKQFWNLQISTPKRSTDFVDSIIIRIFAEKFELLQERPNMSLETLTIFGKVQIMMHFPDLFDNIGQMIPMFSHQRIPPVSHI
jgi:hypothetical protein